MEKHFEINRIYPLKKEHFDAWLNLFFSTVDELYTGPSACLAKKRAAGIAGLMQMKMRSATDNSLL
jgi:hemoglobin